MSKRITRATPRAVLFAEREERGQQILLKTTEQKFGNVTKRERDVPGGSTKVLASSTIWKPTKCSLSRPFTISLEDQQYTINNKTSLPFMGKSLLTAEERRKVATSNNPC